MSKNLDTVAEWAKKRVLLFGFSSETFVNFLEVRRHLQPLLGETNVRAITGADIGLFGDQAPL